MIDPLVSRCLAKRPEDRFQTMLELQHACEAVLAQLPPDMPTMAADPSYPIVAHEDATTTLGSSVGESASHGRPRRLGMWLGISGAAIAAGVVLAVMTTKRGSSEPATVQPALFVPASTTTKTDEPKPEPPKPEPVKPEPPKPEPVKAEPPKPEAAVGGEPEPAKPEVVAEPKLAPKKLAPKKLAPKKPKSRNLYDKWD